MGQEQEDEAEGQDYREGNRPPGDGGAQDSSLTSLAQVSEVEDARAFLHLVHPSPRERRPRQSEEDAWSRHASLGK